MIKNKKVAFEIYYKPFTADLRHILASCSKSITSTAVGFAIAEKLFSLDDRIVDLLPEKVNGAPHKFIAAMTVRHLLTMSTAFSVFKDPLTDD
jgi:CubicO group peptidase (beta-lactamase class C family)